MDNEKLKRAKALSYDIAIYENSIEKLQAQTINSMQCFFEDYDLQQLISDEMFNRFKDEFTTNITVELDKAKVEFKDL